MPATMDQARESPGELICVRKQDWMDRVIGTPLVVLGILPFWGVACLTLWLLVDSWRRGTLAQIDIASVVIVAIAIALTFPFSYYSMIGLRGLYRVIEVWDTVIIDRWGPFRHEVQLRGVETLECRFSRYYKFGLYVSTRVKMRISANGRTIRCLCRYNEKPSSLPVIGVDAFEPDPEVDAALAAIASAIADRLETSIRSGQPVAWATVLLFTREGLTVVADHGNERRVRWTDLTRVQVPKSGTFVPSIEFYAFGDSKPLVIAESPVNFYPVAVLLQRLAPHAIPDELPDEASSEGAFTGSEAS